MTPSAQIELDFQPGLTKQFKSLKECLRTVVYSARGGVNACAIACDLSPTELGKVLNNTEGRRADIDLVEPIIQETGDYRPIYYLIEKFLEDRDAKLKRAQAELPALLERLHATLEEMGK